MRLIVLVFLIFNLLGIVTNANLQDTAGSRSTTAIVGAIIVDGTGREQYKGNVIIRGDRIEAVGETSNIPAGARIIRAEGHTLIPGLFDLHTHLPYAAAGGITGDWPKNLKSYLYCGVTSVVDFGTYPETFEPMRRLIKAGVIQAPRISLAARMTTPGGHGAEGGRGDFFSLDVSTPNQARAAVRSVLSYQPDVIKVFTDGWRYGAAADMTSMNEETLTALVDEAHKNGIEVLTHTVTLERAAIAARAGVDVVAHGIGNARVDDEIIQLMKTKGTVYAPTLAVYEQRGRNILNPILEAVLEPAVRDRIRPELTPAVEGSSRANSNSSGTEPTPRQIRWSNLQYNTSALRNGGVTFGTGTDAGVSGTYHGWATLRELQLLVAGGLTPLEAITAATGNSARALKVDDLRGTIQPNKLADLVLIKGIPHIDIQDIEKISHVFLGGHEIDRSELSRAIASPEPTSIPAIKPRDLIDDFESSDGRSRLDTLWVNSTDSGHDHSKMIFGRINRGSNNRALSITGVMADKNSPFIRANIPLSRGAVEPVDAGEFRGIQFDVRGDGNYRLLVDTYNVRDSDNFQSGFSAGPQWSTVRIEFSSLSQTASGKSVKWTGDDLLMLSFELTGPPGALVWLELDNIRFR